VGFVVQVFIQDQPRHSPFRERRLGTQRRIAVDGVGGEIPGIKGWPHRYGRFGEVVAAYRADPQDVQPVLPVRVDVLGRAAGYDVIIEDIEFACKGSTIKTASMNAARDARAAAGRSANSC
jgi:hypothetical protein